MALSAIAFLSCGGLGAAHAAPQTDGGTGTVLAPPPMGAPPAPVFSFNVTAATDYIFRGVSQTAGQPAIFGSGKVSYDDFYAAAGAENVNFHNSINAEYDLSAGWARTIGGFDVDLGAIRYGYVNEPKHVSIDTTEVRGSVSYPFGDLKLGAAANYAFDYFGTGKDGTYLEANAVYQITSKLSASGAAGRQFISAGNSYTTWNIGWTYLFTKNVALDLRYLDTDAHNLGNVYGSHFVAALKVGF